MPIFWGGGGARPGRQERRGGRKFLAFARPTILPGGGGEVRSEGKRAKLALGLDQCRRVGAVPREEARRKKTLRGHLALLRVEGATRGKDHRQKGERKDPLT